MSHRRMTVIFVIYFWNVGRYIYVFLCNHKHFHHLRSEASPHCPCYRNTASLFINSEA
jgi:hypothetical protein